ncbi:rod shape-determining protein RodA [Pokkaliibacter plantistimulans]|uniref:Rod shape-determining protein RodA n=2 Tax=Pseudomonadota TaxID=1224 RepID=A0ABX5LSW6_9GAMM|nr:DUF4399 domain-containing protein [Pokkaliibacter plantistimulans]PPC78034.1 rod shape-determining protein RodA [Pokkaliibacter plantistimulans]PXF29739.1 rod shape-determining protein RodA [Pokkaliibacter plantistimulans]
MQRVALSLKNVSLLAGSLLAAALSAPLLAADMPRTPAPEGARVYIISPKDGDTVSQTFKVQFGLSGMGVAPAGMDKANTGHHHLLIDVDTLPAMDMPLPATDHIKHFGGGQTETELTLSPGKHTLQLIMGDKLHIPFNPPVISDKITVNVE